MHQMEKLFTSGGDMAKVIVSVGYRDYVLDGGDAMKLLDILAKAEQYEDKWHNKDEATGRESYTTYHIYPQAQGDSAIGLKYLSDDMYSMYKLAGKPEY